MKNGKLCSFTGVAVMAMCAFVLVMALGSCGGSGGTFILTDIPEKFNGKYILLWAGFDGGELYGMIDMEKETNTFHGVQIIDGTAEFPMWIGSIDSGFKRFKGNRTAESEIIIVEFDKYTRGGELAEINYAAISFSKGSGTISYNDADYIYDISK